MYSDEQVQNGRKTMNSRLRLPFCLLPSAFCLVLAALACSRSDAPGPKAGTQDDTRSPIAVEYVRGAELPIHAKPDDASPIVTKYQASEAVSILARKGDWAEVR